MALARILQAAPRPYELASGNPLGSVVNEAIKESITEEEKTDIAEHLGIVPADTIATIGRIGFYRDRLASTLGTITL